MEDSSKKKIETKHFLANQPYKKQGFAIFKRDEHHWDIMAPKALGSVAAFYEQYPDGYTSAKENSDERAFLY